MVKAVVATPEPIEVRVMAAIGLQLETVTARCSDAKCDAVCARPEASCAVATGDRGGRRLTTREVTFVVGSTDPEVIREALDFLGQEGVGITSVGYSVTVTVAELGAVLSGLADEALDVVIQDIGVQDAGLIIDDENFIMDQTLNELADVLRKNSVDPASTPIKSAGSGEVVVLCPQSEVKYHGACRDCAALTQLAADLCVSGGHGPPNWPPSCTAVICIAHAAQLSAAPSGPNRYWPSAPPTAGPTLRRSFVKGEESSAGGESMGVYIAAVGGAVAGCALMALAFVLYKSRRRRQVSRRGRNDAHHQFELGNLYKNDEFGTDNPMRKDWKECTDEASGRSYYVHSKTLERTWVRPTVGL